jgi:membrane-bound serine protease (ClpP class)
MIMFLLEIKVPSYGILTIGGVIALSMGLIMLIDSPIPELQVSWQVIVSIVVLTTLFFVFALGFAIKAQKSKPATGSEGLIGEIGVVIEKLSPAGAVQIHGEIWKAKADQLVKKGSEVEVIEYDGANLTIKVKQV